MTFRQAAALYMKRQDVAVVPEPGTLGLLLAGALGVLSRRRPARVR